MKKIFSISVAAIVGMNTIPTSALADSGEEMRSVVLEAPQLYHADKGDLEEIDAVIDMDTLKSYLCEQLKTCPEAIDISNFNIPNNEKTEEALKVLIWEEIPDAFHVYQLGTWGRDIIENVYATYSYTSEEYLKMYEECMKSANQLLSDIKGNNNLSDVEKALLIHDRLAVLCEYDYNNGENQFDMYGALVNKVSVCQGYAEAYDYLLEQVGIESYICGSIELNHAWNIVYIDNIPYHVDVTWDDYAWRTGARGVAGAVVHDNFLRSSEGIYATEHEASDYDTTPCDTTYDDYFWQDSDAEFQLIEDELYYINSEAGTLNRYSDRAVLCSVDDVWNWKDSGYWPGNYARLSNDGVNLLYSSSSVVYKYDLSTGLTEEIGNPDLVEDTYIYGFTYSDGYLLCDANDCPPYSNYGISNLYQLRIPYEAPSLGDASKKGDVNGDGEVNNLDRQILTRHLAKWEGYEADKLDLKAADVNQDGEVNNLDRQILTRHLAKWEGYDDLPYQE